MISNFVFVFCLFDLCLSELHKDRHWPAWLLSVTQHLAPNIDGREGRKGWRGGRDGREGWEGGREGRKGGREGGT